ncbi:hypothetical protein QNM97_13955 [Gordonia sp. L191]|uniref:hypothetical protein n=1 Tax=Gordonia sp. L191 TaxID=2982699 RepID=UPI0024BF573A|nr:hypothetical protein [Gordonia sp. L191]WHU45156.1 hypothetical protein QNM97_13955 [Gordonia sp. L191]
MNPGDRVRGKDGRTYVILKATEMHYGLVDPTRPPMIDEKNGQQVAHIAVRHEEVEPLPVQGVAQ